jgi:hypothetical protein
MKEVSIEYDITCVSPTRLSSLLSVSIPLSSDMIRGRKCTIA